jgi:hypothetical protein
MVMLAALLLAGCRQSHYIHLWGPLPITGEGSDGNYNGLGLLPGQPNPHLDFAHPVQCEDVPATVDVVVGAIAAIAQAQKSAA